MKKDGVTRSISIIFIYYIIFELAQYIYLGFGLRKYIDSTIFLMIDSLLCLGLVVYLLKAKLKGQWREFRSDYKNKMKKTFKYLLLGMGMMVVSNLILQTFLEDLPLNEQANREMLNEVPMFSIIYMCALAPVIEELLFRLNFKNVFKKKWSYVLATGIFFGALHVITVDLDWIMVLYIIPYSILGMTFSYIFFDTDNVYSSILAHAVNNTFAVLTILFGI